MRKAILALAALAVASALAVAGCGSSSSSAGYGNEEGGSGTAAASIGGAYGSGSRYGAAESKPAAAQGGAPITVASASGVGKVLVDSEGKTLYYFEKDKQGGSTSACNGTCPRYWPPLTPNGAPQAGEGAEASKLGTIKRSDGTMQVTYAGWPLYTYVKDAKPGEANGTDLKEFGGSWYPLHANGEKAGD